MTYTLAVAIAVPVAVLVDVLVLRTRLVLRRQWWTAYAVVLLFQLLTNGWLTGRGIVRYNPADIAGPRLAYAPVEDLGFGFALVLLTTAAWVRAGAANGPARRPL